MGEAKEIPKEMISAVTVATLKSWGWVDPELNYLSRDNQAIRESWAKAEKFAKTALEAAGVDKLVERIARLESELIRLCDAVDGEDEAIITKLLYSKGGASE